MSEETTELETEQESTETTTTQETEAAVEEKAEDKTLISKSEEKTVEAVDPITVKDLTLPEGFEPDAAAQSKFVDIINKGLSGKELANELVTLQTEMVKSASESVSDSWAETINEWKEEAEKSPEFGGDKLGASLDSIQEMIGEVMGEKASSVFEFLSFTGVGNHPALILLLHRIAEERGEGKATHGQHASPPVSLANQMFPNQRQT